jgi:hypothetical protein
MSCCGSFSALQILWCGVQKAGMYRLYTILILFSLPSHQIDLKGCCDRSCMLSHKVETVLKELKKVMGQAFSD